MNRRFPRRFLVREAEGRPPTPIPNSEFPAYQATPCLFTKAMMLGPFDWYRVIGIGIAGIVSIVLLIGWRGGSASRVTAGSGICGGCCAGLRLNSGCSICVSNGKLSRTFNQFAR
jgi:hypothetical protein